MAEIDTQFSEEMREAIYRRMQDECADGRRVAWETPEDRDEYIVNAEISDVARWLYAKFREDTASRGKEEK